MSKLLTKFKRNAIDEFINSIDNQRVSAISIDSAGSGYSNDETVSLLGGTTFTVTTDIDGIVTDVSLVSKGSYNSNIPNTGINAIGGSGTGLAVDVSFESENNFYVFVGGQTPYLTSDVPLESETTSSSINTWNELMFGKKPNFIRMTRKHVWTSGTVYTQYDDIVELKDEDFFVVNSTRDVFKCIYNNNGATSTIEPTKRALKLGVPVKESDGYEWLYLYTIEKTQYTKFTTQNYIPVIPDSLITNAAIDGSIFNISVELDGEDYPHHSGDLLFSNTSTIKLDTGANSTTNYYKDSSIAVINTITGNTYVRKILSSNSELWITTDSFPSNFLSNTDCEYTIGPTITVSSNTGSGVVAYSVADTGSLQKVEIVEYGTGYRDATVTVSAGTGLGSGALTRAIISPLGGHGSNVYDELHVESLGIHCLFDEWEVLTFNPDVTYRTVGIIKNPADANGSPYTATDFNQIATINTVSSSGTFEYGEVVKSISSNKFGRFAYSDGNKILLTGTDETFVQDDEVVGMTSGARAKILENSAEVDLKLYSGEVLYVQNIQEVTRSSSNKEQVKLVISF
jgi:hypothetical protein